MFLKRQAKEAGLDVPVTPHALRERLLLLLPDGDLYENVCTACGDSVGSRKGDPGAEFGGRSP